MDIKTTATHLQRLDQPFDVIIVKNGSEQTLYSNCSPTNVEGLLNDVLRNHQPERLIIQERKRNGSVNVKTNKQEINIGGAMSPQNHALAGFSGASPQLSSQSQIPSEFKDYMISDLKIKAEKWETKAERLDKENYELRTERDNLKLDMKTKDREFELSKKEAKLEESGGLSGIIETVGNNPALANVAAMAIGRLMGVENPMQGIAEETAGQEQPAQTQEQQVPPLNMKVAGFVSDWVTKQDEQTTIAFYEMMKMVAADTESINDFISNYNESEDE